MYIDFEDGVLDGWIESTSGRWEASAVSPVSGNYSLHHVFDNPGNGNDQISVFLRGLQLSAGTTIWRFQVRHGYNPSSMNNWCVFLFGDADAGHMHPEGNVRGYAVGVNYKGSDDLLKLWRIEGDAVTEVINTGINWELQVGYSTAAGLEVTRSAGGLWTLSIDMNGGFDELIITAQATDATFVHANCFGIYYKYSSSQDQKLWFDDLSIAGVFHTDTIPPVIDTLVVLDENRLMITLSENVLHASVMNPQHYFVDQGIGPPAGISVLDMNSYTLWFDRAFTSDVSYLLHLEGITDPAGNVMLPVDIGFSHHQTGLFEVVINEIMADPSPPVGLPECEYIELYNNSTFPAKLDNWKLIIGESAILLPSFILAPGDYVVVCGEECVGAFAPSTPVLMLKGCPALAYAGQFGVLNDRKGMPVSFVHYTDRWYEPGYKSEGGWALEQIDPSNPCGGSGNWLASSDVSGGTPGRRNSVSGKNPDQIPPEVERITCTTDTSIIVWFSEALYIPSVLHPTNYEVDQGIGHPDTVTCLFPEYKTVSLHFSSSFLRNKIYYLDVKPRIMDCSGNLPSAVMTARFSIPDIPSSRELIINEILFNPSPGGSDYVEIYNHSDKVLDLGNIQVSGWNVGTGQLDDPVTVCPGGYLMFPGDYLVLTVDPYMVQDQYPVHDPSAFLPMERMPSLPDSEGTVVLVSQWSEVVDEFRYHEDMHYPLIIDPEGVSLERISFDRPTQDRRNWHSAASTVDYGTPGLQNSQHIDNPEEDKEIMISPEVFSPDNDGYNDVVSLFYTFPASGYVAEIIIYDADGRVVRKLVQNGLLGARGSVTWDGLNDAGIRAPVGIYLFYVEVFNLRGEVTRYKKTCVLAGRLSR